MPKIWYEAKKTISNASTVRTFNRSSAHGKLGNENSPLRLHFVSFSFLVFACLIVALCSQLHILLNFQLYFHQISELFFVLLFLSNFDHCDRLFGIGYVFSNRNSNNFSQGKVSQMVSQQPFFFKFFQFLINRFSI